MELSTFVSRFMKLTLGVRIVVLTFYIAGVNSFALFIIYPSLKNDDFLAHLQYLSIYLLFALPVLAYAARAIAQKINKKYVFIGLGVFLVAIVVLTLMHTQTPEMLISHVVFYLLAGFTEESLWRGILWRFLKGSKDSNIRAYIGTTIHFVLLHIPFAFLQTPSPLFFLGQVVALGIVLGLVRIATKHIVAPAMLHAAINAVVYT